MRTLVLCLGDQLSLDAGAFDDFDRDRDRVWMAEIPEELDHVPCHKLRIAFFLSAMRHFAVELEARDYRLHYHRLSADSASDRGGSFRELLAEDLKTLAPDSVRVLRPGDWRVLTQIEEACEAAGRPLTVVEDRHFYTTPAEFSGWMGDRKQPVMEHFYRMLRKREGVLMDGAKPTGGKWNFDEDNRKSFPASGPPEHKRPRRFQPDEITEDVIELVRNRYTDRPGSLDHFDLPVTRSQALALLREFVEQRLELFGRYEDAIWKDEPFLFHSRLSAVLNLHLLSAQECVEKAVKALDDGAPMNSVEGFVRQILGWREFVRGIYWHHMPGYEERNALKADAALPWFYWDGDTDMACVADAMKSVLRYGYAHHIQRLMVLGLFAQLLGVNPRAFHDWHMAMYLDAIDWVSLPNTVGMSQFADGGIMGTKPYCASGNYIQRMSNLCKGCRYNSKEAVGDDACPFTTLYWDFLHRHREEFRGNMRMKFQLKNLERRQDLEQALSQAHGLKSRIGKGSRV